MIAKSKGQFYHYCLQKQQRSTTIAIAIVGRAITKERKIMKSKLIITKMRQRKIKSNNLTRSSR
jgi:hypothetical protein